MASIKNVLNTYQIILCAGYDNSLKNTKKKTIK